MEKNISTEATVRECPFCKEEIKADAVKCKYCQSSVTPEKPTHQGVCPFCKEDIAPEAIKCKHCKSDLGPAATHQPCPCEGSSNRGDIAQRAPGGGGLPLTFCDEGGTMWCLGDCAQNGCFYFACGSCADVGFLEPGVFSQRRVNAGPMISGAYNSAATRRPRVNAMPADRICGDDGTYWCVSSCGPDYCFYVPCGSCIPPVNSLGGLVRR